MMVVVVVVVVNEVGRRSLFVPRRCSCFIVVVKLFVHSANENFLFVVCLE